MRHPGLSPSLAGPAATPELPESGSIAVEILDAGATETWSGVVYLRHKDE